MTRHLLFIMVVALLVVACNNARPRESIPDGNDALTDAEAAALADEDALLTDPDEETTDDDALLTADSDTAFDDGGDDLLVSDDDTGPVAFHWTLVHPHTDDYGDTVFRGIDFPTVVVFKEALWVTGGENRTDVWRSSDGAAWEKRGSLPASASFPFPPRRPAAAALGDAIFYVNESGVWRSEDGVDWTNIQPDPSFGVRRGMALVAHQGELWLIGGNGGGVFFGDAWRSNDGIQWIQTGMWQTGAHSGNCTPVEGVAGPAAVSMGDRLLAVGGHYSDSCSYTSGYPEIDYSYSVIHYSAQYGLYREEYGWTYPSVPESDDAPFGSHSLLVPFNGEYWSFGGQQWGSDMVRYDRGPGGSGTIIYPGEIVPNHDILTTVEGFDWQLSSYTMPFYEMAGYGAASFKEAIWLIGGNGSNAVWKGSFDPDDPVTDECVKGKYYTGDILIYADAAAENYRGYTAAGRVVIAGSVTDIEPLHCLREVETIEIGYADCDTCGVTELVSFTGLRNLET
ncbi:MAG TPA: hypothetical protein PKH10_10125, partial [bacterium]|nr:hypothetical protein [bacterium]